MPWVLLFHGALALLAGAATVGALGGFAESLEARVLVDAGRHRAMSRRLEACNTATGVPDPMPVLARQGDDAFAGLGSPLARESLVRAGPGGGIFVLTVDDADERDRLNAVAAAAGGRVVGQQLNYGETWTLTPGHGQMARWLQTGRAMPCG